jgi:general secretion pathway protein B
VSYILEALKKSEQDRKKSDAASIYTVEHRALPVEKRINIWAWFFIGLVLCNLFWLALYFFVKAPEAPMVTSASPAPATALNVVSPAPESASAPKEAPVVSSALSPSPVAPLPRQAHNQVTTEKAMVKTYRDSSLEVESSGAPIYETIGPRKGAFDAAEQYEDFSVDPFNAAASNRDQAQRNPTQRNKVLPSPYHLPPEIQQQLPSMRFDSHLYSDDADFRSVIVNGQLLRENDWVSDDLLLFKITELGVILRFGSYAFQMPIVEGWESQR